jgi:hypothetical protein
MNNKPACYLQAGFFILNGTQFSSQPDTIKAAGKQDRVEQEPIYAPIITLLIRLPSLLKVPCFTGI